MLSLGDRRRQRLNQLPLVGAERLGQRRVACHLRHDLRRQLHIGRLGDKGVIGGEKGRQRLFRPRSVGPQSGGELGEYAVFQQRNFADQRLLAGKMVIEVADADARCLRDISHAGLVKSLMGKAVQRGLDNLFSISHRQFPKR